MAQVYNIISIGGFSLAGVFLILAVVFWFRFKIPKIVGDLTGRTAKKSIAQMRSENEKSGKKLYTPQSSGSSGSIKLKSVGEEKTASLPGEKGDESEKTLSLETELLMESNETELLREGVETELLGMTDSLAVGGEESEEGTTLLNETMTDGEPDGFRIIQSIVFIHTQEVI